ASICSIELQWSRLALARATKSVIKFGSFSYQLIALLSMIVMLLGPGLEARAASACSPQAMMAGDCCCKDSCCAESEQTSRLCCHPDQQPAPDLASVLPAFRPGSFTLSLASNKILLCQDLAAPNIYAAPPKVEVGCLQKATRIYILKCSLLI